ncbi:MAG: MobA/MobL family protein [Gloeomargarita sp. SKYB31]|nr:MobA/MobL family protein [Gloeomargarita sp. SKYG98]MCS7226958.1 MobA/MobL family protein [Gloeomargarita sp. SKYB31]
MAIYHCKVKVLKKARSIIAAIAYRIKDALEDLVTGKVWDYRQGQQDLLWEFWLKPPECKYTTRQEVWNAVEAAERRRNARTAREILVAIPAELTQEKQIELVYRFATELQIRYKTVVDVAVHKGYQQRNPHAHILMPTREIDILTGKFGKKLRVLDDLKTGPEEIKWIRQRWEELANEYLPPDKRIDCRSLQDKGILRPPQPHYGPALVNIERRTGEKSQKRIAYEQECKIWERIEKRLEFVERKLGSKRTCGLSHELE